MTNATPADRSDLVIRRFVLVAVWVPVVLVAVGVAVQLVLLPQMPSTVAVHWNAAGEADGFAPAWTQPLMTSLLGLAVPFLIALMTLPGLRRGERGQTYRLLGAAAAAVSALTTTLATWTFAMQTGPDGADEVPMIGLPLVGSLVVAGVVGVGGGGVEPSVEAAGGAGPPATPLALAASERAVWVRTTAMNLGGAIAVVAAVLAVAVAAVIAWMTGAEPLLGWILTGIALLLLVFAATTLALPTMIISETSLSFLGLGLRPPAISWGVLLQQAQNIQALAISPWLLFSAVPVIVVIIAFNFMGDGLRDAADPYGH